MVSKLNDELKSCFDCREQQFVASHSLEHARQVGRQSTPASSVLKVGISSRRGPAYSQRESGVGVAHVPVRVGLL
jgi:hypothetical protein